MRLDDGLQAIIGYSLAGVYIVGALVLFLSWLLRYHAFLRRLPPVGSLGVDTFMGANPFGPVVQAIEQASRTPQSDPDLERLRQAAERWRWPYVAWIFGFPVLVFGIAALLIVSGLIRLA